jgi:PAS domain S-box-containing protein
MITKIISIGLSDIVYDKLTSFLSEKPFMFLSVSSGTEALQKISASDDNKKIIFINDRIYNMSAKSILREIKKIDKNIPTILIGQSMQGKELSELYKYGLTASIFSPFEKIDILEICNTVCDKQTETHNESLVQLPICIATTDISFNITFWNDEAEKQTGLKKEEMIKKNIFEVFSASEQNKSEYLLSKIADDYHSQYYKAKLAQSGSGYIFGFYDISQTLEKEKESERMLNQMVILNDISRTISTTLDIDEFLDNLIQQLHWIYAPTETRFFIYNNDENAFILSREKSVTGYEIQSVKKLTAENSPIEQILDSFMSVSFMTREEHNHFPDDKSLETLVYLPVKKMDEIVAIITMGSDKAHFFDDVLLSSLELLSDIVGISYQNVVFYYLSEEKNDELKAAFNDLRNAKEAIEQQAGYLSQLLEETEKSRLIIEKQNQLKERELKKAAELQNNLLPDKIFESEHIAFESIYIPCLEVAGDIFDVITLENGKIGILVADVSDHGVSSAMIAAMFKMVFSIYSKDYPDSPKMVFKKINEVMHENINTGDYVTAFYGTYDPNTKEFKYASAGHPAVIICDAFGSNVRLLDTDGFFVGMFDFSDYEEKSVTLESGDHLLLYTDGIYEIKNKSNEEYSKERLEENFIRAIQDMNMFPLATLLVTAEMFAEGVPYDDDLTLLHTIIK